MKTLVEAVDLSTVVALVTLILTGVVAYAFYARLVIVPPNRAAVITGGLRTLSDGRKIGYRSITGGRTLRIPIIETVEELSLETMPIEISVNNAFSKGNIPLNVEAIANVKIASEPELVFHNAVERLLGKTEKEIRQLAKDTLTGNLRGVLATLTPEEVNEDRLGFAKALSEDSGEDLAALGFHLDVLKIQNVGDERGYLDAIGRKKAADVIREAEIAEAVAAADTREAQAFARQRAEVREACAKVNIAEAHSELRVRQAELDSKAERAEKIGQVRSEEAKIEAERALEAKRIERETERLKADVIEPARADREAAFARAEAMAAPILARGKAQAEVLKRLYGEVQMGGGDAFSVFLAEKLPNLLEIAVEAVKGVNIDRVVVMDGGSGGGVGNAVNQRLKGAYGTIEGLVSALGIDLHAFIQTIAKGTARAGSPEAEPPRPPTSGAQ